MRNNQSFKEFIEDLFNHYSTAKPWRAGAAGFKEMDKKVSDYLGKCENISEVILLLASCHNNLIVHHAISFLTANKDVADDVFKKFQKYLESSDTSEALLKKYDLTKGINSKDGQILSQWQDEPISTLTLVAVKGLVIPYARELITEKMAREIPILKCINKYLIDSLIKLATSENSSVRFEVALILGLVGFDVAKIKPVIEDLAKNDADEYVKERANYALKVLNKGFKTKS